MNPARILIVDDEPGVLLILERTLRKEGYELDTASSGAEAIQKLGQASYHLILLDMNMQPVSGLQVLAELRKRDNSAVVIILTGHGSIESAVEALHLGAFDYLFKPASPELIRQRVKDGLQRYAHNQRRVNLLEQIDNLRLALQEFEAEDQGQVDNTIPGRFTRVGELVLDHHHRDATLRGQLLSLTTTEFDLLACLAEASPRPVDAHQLISRAFGYESAETEAREIVKWHIHQLRQKIELDPKNPRHIKTVRYKGYLWNS